MMAGMEKDPSLDDFVRSVRPKPEVRLPCADCGEMLYLTVAQCPFCKGKSVIKPCAWCHKEMRCSSSSRASRSSARSASGS